MEEEIETIYNVMHEMNKLWFKVILTEEEYIGFDLIRNKLFDEFFDNNIIGNDFIKILNSLDDLRINFLSGQISSNLEIITIFRNLVFKLIKEKTSQQN